MTAPLTSVTDPDREQDSIPPLCSWEDLGGKYSWSCNLNRDVRRLRWSLDGPLEKAVFVMDHAYYDPNDPPPTSFYCPETDLWHPISQLSLFDPKVSSVTIRVGCLYEWALSWWERHFGYELDEDEERPPGPCGCCGQEDPSEKDARLTIHASSTEGEGYVTIRDYVTAAHPWLMGLRDDILFAAGEWGGYFPLPMNPLPADTKLMVLVGSFGGSDKVDVIPEEKWLVDSKENPFPEHPPPRRRNRLPSPDTTPVGGIDPRMESINKLIPPPALLDAHCWPGI